MKLEHLPESTTSNLNFLFDYPTDPHTQSIQPHTNLSYQHPHPKTLLIPLLVISPWHLRRPIVNFHHPQTPWIILLLENPQDLKPPLLIWMTLFAMHIILPFYMTFLNLFLTLILLMHFTLLSLLLLHHVIPLLINKPLPIPIESKPWTVKFRHSQIFGLGFYHPSTRKKDIECKWVYKAKFHVDSYNERNKERLMAGGFTKVEGIDFFDTFTPFAELTIVRLLLAMLPH